MTSSVSAKTMASALRALAMDAVQKAKSGHPGMPMGMADIAVALWKIIFVTTQIIRNGSAEIVSY